ncbi:MAG: esterase/lipase family protein [Planctomycetota bacterium]
MTRWMLLVALAALTPSCVLFRYGDDIARLEAIGSVSGEVRGADGPIVVALYRTLDGEDFRAGTLWVREGPGPFAFPAAPGKAYLFAFADANRDMTYQPTERFGWYGDPTLLDLGEGERATDLDIELLDAVDAEERYPWILESPTTFEPIDPQATHIGEVVTMDDPRFAPAVGHDGMWEPYRFLEDGREGLFFLEPYAKHKIPVLLIHGIRSAGGDWREVVARLDRTRYQPWILQYPSGFDLATVGLYVHQALLQLHVQHGFERLCIVAHSMGGLVGRNVVSRCIESGDVPVDTFITVSTPWGGHWGASVGVAIAPTVVPVWRDMVPDSPFLQSLWQRPLPDDVHFSMLFSFRGSSDDGVISFESQLPLHVQQRARNVIGLHEDHHSILKSEDLVRLLHAWLARPTTP